MPNKDKEGRYQRMLGMWVGVSYNDRVWESVANNFCDKPGYFQGVLKGDTGDTGDKMIIISNGDLRTHVPYDRIVRVDILCATPGSFGAPVKRLGVPVATGE